MDLLKNISEYIGMYQSLAAAVVTVFAIAFFISPKLRKNIFNILSSIKECFKNLEENKVDDFRFNTLEISRLININNGIGKKRGIFSSYDSSESIQAIASNGTLKLVYKHISDNTDMWVSYVINGFDEIEEYCTRGYYLIFKCKSDDVKTLILEARYGINGENKIEVPIEKRDTYCFINLKKLFLSPKHIKEICFVIRPYKENKLKGKIEISDINLVKNIVCKEYCRLNYKKMQGSSNLRNCNCNNKYRRLS
ncbi:MAG: hypothetical protein CVV02_17610 [Firmicutes bacterium HGW-Firmicutes-7]|nr:MAG: hypothetical protein CVV02_17610 [Firmicutes bacterium HGW-Firmicutes-7]